MNDFNAPLEQAKGQTKSSLSPSQAFCDECDRLEHLPLLLAGPILRRTESDAVTVWVALKAPREVTLKIYATEAQGSTVTSLQLEGTGPTVPIGKYLHIVAITAHPINSNRLKPGQIYAYDLSFGNHEPNLALALTAEHTPHVTVSYFEHQLPTFALPPDDLNDLRLAHGSCRKLHGGGSDALPLLDDLIEYSAKRPNARLHQLFFTGDQIYGDDVPDPLLRVATEIGNTLLGWEENLPLSSTPGQGCKYKKPSELKPGQRTDIAKDFGGFTAMLIDSPDKAKSHLFSLGEYMAIYLLTWSPILWPDYIPEGKDIHEDSKLAALWNKEVRHVNNCITLLWKVRRAMANVPTYMIFDDHDISDDWYLNRAWCTSVLGKPLGRRTVQNGLLAYALFQAWGNTPDQFQEGQPGGRLLNAAVRWSASAGTDESACEEMAKLLGIPELEPKTGLPKFKRDGDVLILDRDYVDGTVSIEWHYTIRSQKHEVLVLDTRTWRGYPHEDRELVSILDPKAQFQILKSKDEAIGLQASNAYAPPMLLCPTAFQQQLQHPLEFSDYLKQKGESEIEVTFVVLPTNLVSLRIIDLVQRLELEKGSVFNSDVGDAWNLNEIALSRLLTELFEKRRVVVVLTGDIHYGGCVRLSYWFNPRPAGDKGIGGQGDRETGGQGNKETRGQGNKETRGQGDRETGGQGGNFTDIAQQISPLSSEFLLTKAPVPSPQSSICSNARVLAQLTASAFKNGELKTYFVHTKAKSLAPEAPQNWVGWHEPPQLVEIQIAPERVRIVDVDVPATGPVVRQITGAQGTWNIAWEIALKDGESYPDWQYYIEWIKREKAKLAPWIDKEASSAHSKDQTTTGWFAALGNLVSQLWRNQWIQEGEEIIGRNNFGVVSLKWSQHNEEAENAVIQDTYWQPPWEPTSVVYSRYFVPLQVDCMPPQLKAIAPYPSEGGIEL